VIVNWLIPVKPAPGTKTKRKNFPSSTWCSPGGDAAAVAAGLVAAEGALADVERPAAEAEEAAAGPGGTVAGNRDLRQRHRGGTVRGSDEETAAVVTPC
jgi:hypothetical protein